jgi:ADP-ribose pyrophosphatase
MLKDHYSQLLRTHPNLFENEKASIKTILDEDMIDEWNKNTITSLQEKTLPIEWAEIGVVFDDPRIIILRDLVEFPGGFRNGYIIIYNRAFLEKGSAGVVVLPERDGKILLMHNFRHATRQWHWEIPRGFGEPGVSAEDQAKVEAKEEIGVEPENIELVALGTLYNNTGLEGNPIDLFFAHITTLGILNQEIGTDELRWVSVSELEKMIADGDITDGFTIATYVRAKLKGLI